MNTVSVIVPIKDEEQNIGQLFERLIPVVEKNFDDYEILCIDDGSEDNTVHKIKTFCLDNQNIKLVSLSKNFGAFNAVRAGSMIAEKELTFWIAADLQDPPEILTEMKEYIENGFEVVWGLRAERKDPIIRKVLTGIFYKFLNLTSENDYPPKGVDMCLMTKNVRDKFNNLSEKSGFIQSLIINFGFKQHFIQYNREKRNRGVSKWSNYRKLTKMAVEMVTTSSSFPINFLLFIGTLGLTGSFIKIIHTIFLNYSQLNFLTDFVIFFFFFFCFISGWLGTYTYNVLSEVRNRPLFYFANQFNLSDNQLKTFKEL